MSERDVTERLETQLRDAHIRNSEYVDELKELRKQKGRLPALEGSLLSVQEQLDATNGREAAAEKRAATLQRKLGDAHGEIARLKDGIEELRELKNALSDQLVKFDDLNERVRSAKTIGDLFGD